MTPTEKGINIQESQRYWYALYTRPRFEKKVDTLLKEKNLQSFLPEREVIRHWSNNRRRKIKEPLFSSYVFVFADLKERYSAVRTAGVARLVGFNGQPVAIPEEQIQTVYNILKCGYDPEPYQFLNYGDEVEITAGQLQGLHGFYVENRGKNRLVVSVKTIQQSIAIEVDRRQIRRIRSEEHRGREKFSAGYRVENTVSH